MSGYAARSTDDDRAAEAIAVQMSGCDRGALLDQEWEDPNEPPASDHERALNIALVMAGPLALDVASAYMSYLATETRALLYSARAIRLVDALVFELLACGTLGGDQVRAIFEGA